MRSPVIAERAYRLVVEADSAKQRGGDGEGESGEVLAGRSIHYVRWPKPML
ncbi:MAG: hypothetical protein CM1200mP2_21890 [Planctomycetaceae bacterium]|nr:hypothetical protein [Planctomycetota bacterium]GIS59964.1 MAG: hypothetical protein CM1200mP2_21890 [Planctomycetaceae bacterium]